MHELSLAEHVLDIVEQAAQRESFQRVRVLRLQVGALAGVDLHALRFALEHLATGTRLECANIEIETPDALGWCANCAMQVPMTSRTDPCSHCGSWGLHPVGGTALRVLDLLVDDQPKEALPCA